MMKVNFDNREIYRSLFSASSIPIVLTDKKDRIIDANREYCSLLGYSKDELLSMTLDKLISGAKRSRRKNILLTGIENHADSTFETVNVSKSGRMIPVEITVMPIKSSGKTFYFSIVRDITEEKNIQKDLIRSEKRYRTFFENAGISIWEEDFSGAVKILDSLRASGVKDLRKYIEKHPDFIFSVIDKIKVLDINNETLNLMEANSKDQILGSLDKMFDLSEEKVIREELIAIWNKQERFVSEINFATLKKKKVTAMLNMKFPREKEEFKSIIVSIIDITKLKKTEDLLKNALEDKKILLKELHHRTKNNMQMIGSLLTLKSGYTDNDSVIEIFEDMKNRINSMSIVHEKLYQSDSLHSIHLNEYIDDIIITLKNSYLMSGSQITIDSSMEDVIVPIDKAIPMGIILNELLANVFKYAFPDGRPGTVKISLKKNGNMLNFRLKDNGVGVPEGFDFRKHDSLGMKLVFSIAEDQLGGRIRYTAKRGITWLLDFPLK